MGCVIVVIEGGWGGAIVDGSQSCKKSKCPRFFIIENTKGVGCVFAVCHCFTRIFISMISVTFFQLWPGRCVDDQDTSVDILLQCAPGHHSMAVFCNENHGCTTVTLHSMQCIFTHKSQTLNLYCWLFQDHVDTAVSVGRLPINLFSNHTF